MLRYLLKNFFKEIDSLFDSDDNEHLENQKFMMIFENIVKETA